MSGAKAKLGDIVEAYCSRCRLNLDTNVAAVCDGEINKVQCRTCGNFVAYKPPVDMDARRQAQLKKLVKMQAKKRKGAESVAEKAPAGDGTVATERWKKLVDAVDSRYARPYDRHRGYKAGDFILHKKWGMGHVESVDEEQLIALFKAGLESLSHNEPREDW